MINVITLLSNISAEGWALVGIVVILTLYFLDTGHRSS